jgi:hypothetical protein
MACGVNLFVASVAHAGVLVSQGTDEALLLAEWTTRQMRHERLVCTILARHKSVNLRLRCWACEHAG